MKSLNLETSVIFECSVHVAISVPLFIFSDSVEGLALLGLSHYHFLLAFSPVNLILFPYTEHPRLSRLILRSLQ